MTHVAARRQHESVSELRPLESEEHRHLIGLRRELHRVAEPSGEELITAARLVDEVADLAPDSVVDHLGGHGVAVVFDGSKAGPTVLLRADMDAVPIDETLTLEYASATPGISHKCGHDGHMAMAVGVARCIARARPDRGRVVVLFQPSEETGGGAAAIIGDPAFAVCRPDTALAAHNLPGYGLGRVVIRPGTFACASRGLTIELVGATCHAAEPEPVPGKPGEFVFEGIRTEFYDESVHYLLDCIDCHEGITELDHETPLPAAQCASCHDPHQDPFGGFLRSPNEDDTCLACHS